MEVQYTNSWFDITAEGEAAKALMSDGCVIIGQHADSTGAPSAAQEVHESGEEVYSVGYNVDMLNVAPDAALTSATNNWSVYYKYAFECLINGEKIDTDWAKLQLQSLEVHVLREQMPRLLRLKRLLRMVHFMYLIQASLLWMASSLTVTM